MAKPEKHAPVAFEAKKAELEMEGAKTFVFTSIYKKKHHLLDG